MPYPSFGNCRCGWIHHQIPLCHHKSRNDRQRNKVQRSIESLVGAVEQDRGHDPREITRAEPQRSNDNWNASDVRETATDFKMIMSEGEACRSTHILHGERDRNGNNKKDEHNPKAVEKRAMHECATNEDRRQNLCERRWVPRISDCGDKEAGYR